MITTGIKEKNTLQFRDRLRVYEWLKENDEKLAKNQTTYDEAAAFASRDLDLALNISHLKSIMSQFEGEFQWRGGPYRKRGNPSGVKLEEHEERVSFLEQENLRLWNSLKYTQRRQELLIVEFCKLARDLDSLNRFSQEFKDEFLPLAATQKGGK